MFRLVSVLACVALLPAALGLPVTVLGDAGGADAGNSPGDATAIGPGSYMGNLTPGDSDWYSLVSSVTSCFDVDVVTQHAMRVAVRTASGTEFVGDLDEGLFSAVVAVAPSGVRLGIVPDVDPWDDVSVGPYAFDVALAPPAATGEDHQREAGNNSSNALALPASCVSGRFRADGPDVDYWTIPAQAGQIVRYSLAASVDVDATLVLLHPNGTAAGPLIGDGELAQASVPADGTYYLLAIGPRTTVTVPYVLAATAADPGFGCRPMCLSIE